MRERGGPVAVAADHLGVDDQRIEDRLFDRLRNSGKEIIHSPPGHKRQLTEFVIAGIPDRK